uniref:Glucosamine 6-phosphate N-acetyltransferase n=1 Tax=Syphacia muris TaxID=451379 RepID=A0A0N5AK78_9BILA
MMPLPEGYCIRPLHVNDLTNNYMNLLKNGGHLHSYDIKILSGVPIGTVTLTIEYKFIHKLGARGRIESFYVDPFHKSTGIDKFLISSVLKLAVQVGTYKVSTNSSNELLKFFGDCGLNKDPGNNAMVCESLGVLPNFRVRPLHLSDFDKGFLGLLQQLTVVGDVMKVDFQKSLNTIVGSGTLFVDAYSFRHVGHIEDIVVDAKLRGKNLGKLLNLCLLQLARCLKLTYVSLECRDRLVSFYEQFGYKKKGSFLVLRFDK